MRGLRPQTSPARTTIPSPHPIRVVRAGDVPRSPRPPPSPTGFQPVSPIRRRFPTGGAEPAARGQRRPSRDRRAPARQGLPAHCRKRPPTTIPNSMLPRIRCSAGRRCKPPHTCRIAEPQLGKPCQPPSPARTTLPRPTRSARCVPGRTAPTLSHSPKRLHDRQKIETAMAQGLGIPIPLGDSMTGWLSMMSVGCTELSGDANQNHKDRPVVGNGLARTDQGATTNLLMKRSPPGLQQSAP